MPRKILRREHFFEPEHTERLERLGQHEPLARRETEVHLGAHLNVEAYRFSQMLHGIDEVVHVLRSWCALLIDGPTLPKAGRTHPTSARSISLPTSKPARCASSTSGASSTAASCRATAPASTIASDRADTKMFVSFRDARARVVFELLVVATVHVGKHRQGRPQLAA